MYEVLPLVGGSLLALLVARRAGTGAALGFALAGLLGVIVSFASGEWRGGILYPLWDCTQATISYAVVLATARRFERRRPE